MTEQVGGVEKKKRGRPVGAKDKKPRKKKGDNRPIWETEKPA